MRRVLGLGVLAGCVALAITVGQRMSADAMAVAIGVVFGVAASIPASLLIVVATRGRQAEPPPRREEWRPAPPAPQIFVVSPPAQPGVAPGVPWQQSGVGSTWPTAPAGYGAAESARRFKVVGEDEHWLEAPAWRVIDE